MNAPLQDRDYGRNCAAFTMHFLIKYLHSIVFLEFAIEYGSALMLYQGSHPHKGISSVVLESRDFIKALSNGRPSRYG